MRFMWLRTFCVVVALMSLAFLMGTGIILLNLRQNSQQFTERQAQISQSVLESQRKNSYNYGMQVFYDGSAKSLEQTELRLSSNRKDAYQLAGEMYNHTITNPIIEDLFLYYPGQEYVVGAKGVYSADAYGMLVHIADRSWKLETWKELMFQRRTGFFTVTQNEQIQLYYRLATVTENGRILVAKFNMGEVAAILESIGGSQSNSLTAIVDDEMRVYCYAGDGEFVDGQTNRLREIDRSRYFYVRVSSSEMPLHYVAVTETSAVSRAAGTVGVVAVGCILLSTAMAFWLSFYFTDRNMKPLLSLIDRYGRKERRSPNELLELQIQMDELNHENQEALMCIQQQKQQHLVSVFLNECFKSNAKNQQSVSTLVKTYDLSFENTHFVIVLQKWSERLPRVDLVNLVEEWEDDTLSVYWTQEAELDLFLLNFDWNEQENVAYHTFLRRLQDITGDLKSTAVSRQTNNIEEIRSCYLECLRQLKLPEGLSKESSRAYRGQVLYNSFAKYVQDQEYTNAGNMIQELYSGFVDLGSELERENKRWRIMSLLLAAPESQRHERELAALAAEREGARWCEQLRKVLRQMQRTHQFAASAAGDDSVAAQIRAFIDKEYGNPSLNLQMISEFVGLSESYVSKIFKSEYDMGISQYLNMVRIEQAKALLQMDTLSIKAIALQVGYASDANFIRVFKKLEGRTPGAYRYQEDESC